MTLRDQMLMDVPKIVHIFLKKKPFNVDRDELIQEVRLRLLKHPPDLEKYKPTTCIAYAINYTLIESYRKKEIKTTGLKEKIYKDNSYQQVDNNIDVHKIMKCITEREQKILQNIFGINCKLKTERVLAEELNISKALINMLKHKALKRIKEVYGHENLYCNV